MLVIPLNYSQNLDRVEIKDPRCLTGLRWVEVYWDLREIILDLKLCMVEIQYK